VEFDLPVDPCMLRVSLLMQQAGHLTRLVDRVEDRLVAGGGGNGTALALSRARELRGDLSGMSGGKAVVVRWDGSFGEGGAGIGITISEVDGTGIA
jgi:hypothetical protein